MTNNKWGVIQKGSAATVYIGSIVLIGYIWTAPISGFHKAALVMVAVLCLALVSGFVKVYNKDSKADKAPVSKKVDEIIAANDETLGLVCEKNRPLVDHIKTAIWEVVNEPVFLHAIEVVHSSTSLDVVGLLDMFDEPLEREIEVWYKNNLKRG